MCRVCSEVDDGSVVVGQGSGRSYFPCLFVGHAARVTTLFRSSCYVALFCSSPNKSRNPRSLPFGRVIVIKMKLFIYIYVYTLSRVYVYI